MLTDEKVIKAFECCTKIEEGCGNEYCVKCPMFKEDVDECTASLFGKVLDLIKRQQAEIDGLEMTLEVTRDNLGATREELNKAETEIEVQKTNNHSMAITLSNRAKVERAEAIKDFAERLKKFLLFDRKRERTISVVTEREIDNLVKELTEGSK